MNLPFMVWGYRCDDSASSWGHRQRLKENASIHTICALDVATGQSGKSCAKGVSAAQTDLEKEEA